MKQEQAILNLLEGENRLTRAEMIIEWLEDINWTPEARLLAKKYNEKFEEADKYLKLEADKEVVNMYRAISKIYGYGIGNDEFGGDTAGEKLVDYLFNKIIIIK